MTKKDRILKMVDSAPWHNNHKILLYEHFRDAGLDACMEDFTTYNDIIYAKRILQNMGYTIRIGMAFHIIKEIPQSNE